MSPAGIGLRNLGRNKSRTVMTILGVAVAVLAFVVLRTVISAWTSAAEHSAKDRIATRHKVTFIMTLPKRYITQIRATPGIKAATFANWFGGKHPVQDKEFFASLAVDSGSFFSVYDDMKVPDDQLQAWRQDRRGVIVGDVLAKKFGWKVGDRVNLRGTIFPGTWQFNVRGIYQATRKAVDRSTFVFHWDYLNESVTNDRQRDQIGWVVSRVADAGASARLSKAIDARFDAEDNQTVTMSERDMNVSFMGMLSAVLTAIDVVSVVIMLIMALIIGNTIAMGVRERTNEYGMLRALGFSGRHIAGFIFGESIALGLLGAGVGLALAYPLINGGIGRFVEENMGAFFPYFRVGGATIAMAMTIALALGVIAAALPAYRASKLRVVDALRRVG